MTPTHKDLSESVVILAPTENDSLVATSVLLEAGIKAESVPNLPAMCSRMNDPVGAIILADESLNDKDVIRLQELLQRQDSWSDIPIILLTTRSGAMASEFFSSSGNISLLERPFGSMTLVRAVDVALRARRKQYQVRDLLEQQRQATQARDDFFATLSHELRTPLSVILGWIEILRAQSDQSVSPQYGLQIIERSAHLQKELIDDLLDISRIITGKLNIDLKPLDFGTLVRSVVNGFAPQAQAKSILLEFVLSPPDRAYPILGDEQRLNQTIANLISNAIKFTPRGGRIIIKLENQKDSHILTVTDTGRGIEPSFLPSIFDRLKQEDMSSTRGHGGMGLGLAIAFHIVQAHHGIITAHSEGRDKGATIKIVLPMTNVELISLQNAPALPLRQHSLHGIKILAVDDSPEILEVLELFLDKAEAEVHPVESARAALDALEKFRPDVILSDIGMPDMDGYQLISQIRKRPANLGGKVPAIALTAYARDEERVKALRAGFQMHVSKPISPEELISAIAFLAK